MKFTKGNIDLGYFWLRCQKGTPAPEPRPYPPCENNGKSTENGAPCCSDKGVGSTHPQKTRLDDRKCGNKWLDSSAFPISHRQPQITWFKERMVLKVAETAPTFGLTRACFLQRGGGYARGGSV